MGKWCCSILFCLGTLVGNAQQYLLFLTDKGGTNHTLANPSTYLSPKALERRQRAGTTPDSTDLPVSAQYLNRIGSIAGVTVLNASRWLNAVSVRVNGGATLQQLQQLPFVRTTRLSGSTIRGTRAPEKKLLGKKARPRRHAPFHTEGLLQDYFRYGSAEAQVAIHNGAFLHNIGLRGQGMLLGMLDAGFYQYQSLPAFDSLRASARIRDTWDFVAREASVAEDDAHGMYCLSIIAANIPGSLVGSAPGAAFLLYRSEDAASETVIEELNWVCAAERVDSAGGDIISSSLGYNQFDGGAGNYSYADMNGDITLSARGADLAARKGILVVNSAGNSGNSSWRYITTPADGDSVLAVGAVNATGTVGGFSSYGPAADGRIKPDVASVGVGTFFQGTNGGIASGNGTSFSCPNIAGLAACLWQAFPQAINMDIIRALRSAGNKAGTPDDRVGYGVPDVKKALGMLVQQFARTTVTTAGCRATLNWQSWDVAGMQYVIERREAGSAAFRRVGTTSGTGTSFGNRNYTFIDALDGIEGNIDYRIGQIIDTASASRTMVFLDTVSAVLNTPCSGSSRFAIYPNAVRDEAQLMITAEEAIPELTLMLLNNAGQQVWTQRSAKPEGNFRISLPTRNLAAGKYYLRIADSKQQLAVLELVRL